MSFKIKLIFVLTDSRQTAKYNEDLSDRRANSTREWLINRGIWKPVD
jgi:outer membrane protein OmpA-like peptidoglycan-associated protein